MIDRTQTIDNRLDATAARTDLASLRRFHMDRWRGLLRDAALDDLLVTVISAEIAWLAKVDAVERRAARLAYWSTWRLWPSLCEQRMAQGWGVISAEYQHQFAAQLQTLIHEAAIDPTTKPLPSIQPPHFYSAIPLIGPLIAGLRTMWNRIAAGPYTDHLRRQQNAFNSAITTHLQQFEHSLTTVENKTLTDDAAIAAMNSRCERESSTFAATDDLLESVALRLHILEQRYNR